MKPRPCPIQTAFDAMLREECDEWIDLVGDGCELMKFLRGLGVDAELLSRRSLQAWSEIAARELEALSDRIARENERIAMGLPLEAEASSGSPPWGASGHRFDAVPYTFPQTFYCRPSFGGPWGITPNEARDEEEEAADG